MWIKVEIINGVVRASFTSTEVTGDEMIQQAGRELMDVVDAAAETKKLVLSFKGVEFMSSAMIGKLVLLNKKAKSRGVQIRFCDIISPNVLEVLIITRLDKTFRIIRPDDDNDDDDDGPGNAGVFAKLPKNPSSGGAHAKPPRDDR